MYLQIFSMLIALHVVFIALYVLSDFSLRCAVPISVNTVLHVEEFYLTTAPVPNMAWAELTLWKIVSLG